MRAFFRNNGLTIALIAMFLLSVLGMIWSGQAAHNEDLREHGAPLVGLAAYVTSGDFLAALFENWESEFLQMWAYVMLTAYLFQRGSPESRDPDGEETRPGEKPGAQKTFAQKLYAHSLGLSLLALFLLSFTLHWINSARHAAEKAAEKGLPDPGLIHHLGDAQLWFESFQNWQSEFLSTAVLVVLGVFLRERLSPESKAVGDPNSKTGA